MNKESLIKMIAILLVGAAIGGGIAYAVMPKGEKPKEEAVSKVMSSVLKEEAKTAEETKSESLSTDEKGKEETKTKAELELDEYATNANVSLLSGEAGKLQKKILMLNQGKKVPKLDVYKKIKVKKGKHDWWRDESFLLSEGLKAEILPEDAEDEYVYKNKNDCELRRKQFIS